jgi:hypothetical protein
MQTTHVNQYIGELLLKLKLARNGKFHVKDRLVKPAHQLYIKTVKHVKNTYLDVN